MATLYARQTALPNLLGRINYISSSKRQENLLAFHDGAAGSLNAKYWRLLALESQAAFDRHGEKTRIIKDRKTGELKEITLKAVQGREIHGKLPNSLLERLEPAEIAKILADDFQQLHGRPAAVAVHFNKKRTNLHFHLIYSERELLQEPLVKVAERNLFFDETGKRQYKKAAILGTDGELRAGCRIVKKGEIYEKRFFGNADQRFSSRGWLKSVKTNWLLPLLNGKLAGDVAYQEFDHESGKLPQIHVGNGPKEDVLDMANVYIRQFNLWYDQGKITKKEAKEISKAYRSAPLESRDGLLCAFLDEVREKEERRKRSVDYKIQSAQKKRYLPPNTIDLSVDMELQKQLDKATGRNIAAEERKRRKEYWERRNKEKGR